MGSAPCRSSCQTRCTSRYPGTKRHGALGATGLFQRSSGSRIKIVRNIYIVNMVLVSEMCRSRREKPNISLKPTPEVHLWIAGGSPAGRLEGFAMTDTAGRLNSALCSSRVMSRKPRHLCHNSSAWKASFGRNDFTSSPKTPYAGLVTRPMPFAYLSCGDCRDPCGDRCRWVLGTGWGLCTTRTMMLAPLREHRRQHEEGNI